MLKIFSRANTTKQQESWVYQNWGLAQVYRVACLTKCVGNYIVGRKMHNLQHGLESHHIQTTQRIGLALLIMYLKPNFFPLLSLLFSVICSRCRHVTSLSSRPLFSRLLSPLVLSHLLPLCSSPRHFSSCLFSSLPFSFSLLLILSLPFPQLPFHSIASHRPSTLPIASIP